MTAPSPARSGFSLLLLLSLAHGIVDLSSGALIGLLPTLRGHFGLSYTLVGTITLVSNLTSSLTQPVFGLLSDRSSQRWLIPFSLLAGGLGVAAIGYMPGYWWMLVAFVLSALGTASFHPEGAVLGNTAQSATYVQVMYMMAGVFVTLFGAPLADRLGVKRLLVLSFAVLLPLQLAIPFLSGWALLVFLFLAGATVVTTFTNTLILTQQYMPGSPGLASGINLGLAFGMGGVGTLLLGKVADQHGIVAALLAVAALVPLALGLAAVLPPVAGARQAQVAEATPAEAK